MSKTAPFKIGDIVQLKSGGPPMTVQDVRNFEDYGTIACSWFSGKKLEHGTFHVETLVFAEDTGKKTS